MKVDVIIVGQGLAGSALAMALIKKGKSVLVIDRADPSAATRVAAGLITTLAGKGMNPAWRQGEYLPKAIQYYQELEKASGTKLFYPHPVLRLFSDEKERAKLERKAESISQWLGDRNPDVDQSQLHGDFGGFEMKHSGRLDTLAYLKVVRELIESSANYSEQDFVETDVTFSEQGVSWKDVSADKLILCQGYQGLKYGWFSYLPHRSAKGEMLTVKVDQLDASRILSRNGWMVPLGDGLWRAGATYEWEHLEAGPSDVGRKFGEKKVAEFTKLPFSVEVHEVGVRPIIQRSQPVIGMHKEISQLGFFNGLGSKGVITSPCVAEHFADVLYGESELDPELALARFDS